MWWGAAFTVQLRDPLNTRRAWYTWGDVIGLRGGSFTATVLWGWPADLATRAVRFRWRLKRGATAPAEG